MKRVCNDQSLDFLSDFVALSTQCCQLLRQARQDDGSGLSAQHHDGLFRERLDDLSSPALSHYAASV